MKNWKRFQNRGLALFLALVMCVSTLHVTAFAAEQDEGTGIPLDQLGEENAVKETEEGKHTTTTTVKDPVDVSLHPPEIPEDAESQTGPTTNEQLPNGNNESSTTTTTTWGSEEKTEGEFAPSGSSTTTSEDGKTTTTVETQTKNDIVVTINGEQTRTDYEVTNPEGNRVSDSWETEGSQTTTTTETNTTVTTTTEVRTDEESETKDIVGEESKAEDVGDPRTEGPIKSNVTDNKPVDSVDEKDTAITTPTNQPDVTVTVSANHTQDSQTKNPTLDTPTAEALGALIQDLVGWDLVDVSGNPIGKVQANGTVLKPDGTTEPLVFTAVGNGSFQLELQTSTQTSTTTTPKSDNSDNPEMSEVTTTKGETGPKTEGDLTSNNDKTTDGNVTTETFTKVDTANRTDTNTWTETTTTVEGKEQVDTSKKQTIVVSVQNGRTVIGYWDYAKDESWNELAMAKPQDSLLSDGSGRADATLNGKDLCNDKPALTTSSGGSGQFKYVGYGVASTVLIKKSGAWSETSAHQFKLVDSQNGDKAYYVYCADMGTTAYPGRDYNMTNVNDADYYKGTNGAEHIQAIAANGYWGTANGETGSLTAIQAKLKSLRADSSAPEEIKNLSDAQINALTDGIALTATQAAIWTFGTVGDVNLDSDNPIQWYRPTSGNSNEIYHNLTDNEKAVGKALYKLLISDYLMNSTKHTATDILQTSDIQNVSVTVKDKVVAPTPAEIDALAAQVSTPDVYNTDVSFTMAVVPSAINDDLLVRIYVGGELKETRRLSGSNKAGENFGAITADANGVYTIPGIQVAEGVSIKLKLEGTQKLEPGVYLYQSAGSQTFVGLATGESTRHVDLEVGVHFNVTEATQKTDNKITTTTTTNTWDETTKTEQDKQSTTDVTEETTTIVTVTTTVTEVTDVDERITEESIVWSNSGGNTYNEEYIPGDDDDDDDIIPGDDDDDDDDDIIPGDDDDDVIPGDDDDDTIVPDEPAPRVDIPDDPAPQTEIPDDVVPLAPAVPEEEIPDEEVPLDELEILDEDVPLANIPQTGDISALWYLTASLSALGLAALAVLSRKKREEEV